MIALKIDLNKVDKARIFHGKAGSQYIDLVLIRRQSSYGDDGFISHSTTKEERDKGIKGAIIGSWKELRLSQGSVQEQTKNDPWE